jgi:hypothetical protein
LGLVQRGRIVDAWAARLTGQGVDHHVGRADEPSLHRGRRVDRQPFLHQRLIEATAELGEPCREHNMRLGAIPLDLGDPTGIHHRQVGPQAATNLCIGAGPCMFQEF